MQLSMKGGLRALPQQRSRKQVAIKAVASEPKLTSSIKGNWEPTSWRSKPGEWVATPRSVPVEVAACMFWCECCTGGLGVPLSDTAAPPRVLRVPKWLL